MIVIEHASSEKQIELVRALFREYARSLGTDLGYQNFEQELRELPGTYTPPDGRMLLATDFVEGQRKVAGCGALRPVERGVCEMKRLFVRAEFRGRGIGRALAENLIRAAVETGYGAMQLDTLPTMHEAHQLYRELGFREIAPYYESPVAGTRFLELPLASARAHL